MINLSLLIEKAKNGDTASMSALYKMTWNQIYPSVLFLLKNKEEAEDVMQEGYLKGFQKLGELKEAEKFVPWLKSICLRKGLDFLRKAKLNTSRDFEEEHFAHIEDEVEDDQMEMTENLLQTITNLPRGFQVVIQMHAFEGMPHAEIAAHLGITPSTARSQYARAIQKLRKEMING